MKNKSLMFFTVLAFMLLFVPTVKAEAAIRQTGATADAVNIEWDPVAGAKGYVVVFGGDQYGLLSTSVKISGLKQGAPYYVVIKPAYSATYRNGQIVSIGNLGPGYDMVIRTTPNKLASDEYYVSWNSKDKVKVEYVDTSLYSLYSGYITKFIDGIEFRVKDVKGKVKKTVKKTPKHEVRYSNATDLIDSFTFSAPSAIKNKGMQYQFRTYIEISKSSGGTQKIYSDWTSAKAYVPQAKITNLQVVGKNKVKVTWKKVSGAKNYTIYKTTNGGKSFKKVKTVKANSTTAPAANNTVRKPQANGSSYKKVSTVSSTTSSYTVSGFKKGSKYGVVVVANKVKVGKKKYNSTRSYYTHR